MPAGLRDPVSVIGRHTQSIGAHRRRSFDYEPAGRVIEQDPPAARQIEAGSAVDLVFSSGPKTVEVPSVTGLSVTDAEAALETAGLVLGEQAEQNDQSVPEGQIISQDPAAGEEVPEETPVNVVVSAGPSVVIVPDVTCRSYASAKAQLEGLGLIAELGDPVLPRPECPNPINVAQQDTPAGTAVDPGTVILLHQGMVASPSPSPSPTDSPSP